MSFLTGTNTELIYASTAAFSASASFTSEQTVNPASGASSPVQAQLPPNFWLANNAQPGRGIRIVARGILSSTGTPTYTFSIRTGAASNTSSAIILGSAALTTGSGVSNQFWELQGDVILTSIGKAGTNSTVQGIGYLLSTGLANTLNPIYGGAASPGTVATVDTSITNYINFNITCSASSSSNTITLNQLLVYGLN